MGHNITELYDDYKDGNMDRRSFLQKLTLAAGSSAAALACLSVLEDANASVTTLPQGNEPVTQFVNYPAPKTDMRAFLAHPGTNGKFPAVVVIHENRGLQPHIQDVTRRFAKEGFLAMAPDALTPLGGTPDDTAKAAEMMRELNTGDTIDNMVAAVKYLKTHPLSTGKVGCTGFCWGGAMTNNVAVHSPDLDAAVPYYGRQPAAEDVAKIKAPILAHYAENDPGINAGIEAFEDELKKQGKEYRIYIYEGTAHAFNNDTNTERYNAEAAKLAWGRTVDFFKEKLK